MNKMKIVITHATGVTEHSLPLQLNLGKPTGQFWPDGSGGVGGHRSGRQVELHWDGR